MFFCCFWVDERSSYIFVLNVCLFCAPTLAAHGAPSVEEDEDEAEEWENEGEVDGRETEHDSLVDDPSLQRWENAATDNGLHQKGCAESGVALLHVFQGNAVDAEMTTRQ